MDLDSALLRAFVAVANELHFGRAAPGLFISQQALSKRIARLESTLGVRLLDRGRHGASLTAAGARLLPEARKVVDAVDAAASAARPAPAMLTVDVLDEHLSMLPRVRAMTESENQMSLSAVMRHTAGTCVSMLRGGDADLALGRPGSVQTPWPTDIRARPVLAEPIQLLVPVDHVLGRAEHITLAELSEYRLWFPSAGAPAEWTDLLNELACTFKLTVDQAGSTFGFDYWAEHVARGSAPPSLVGAGMALPAGLAVSRVPIVEPIPVFWWWAIWRRRLPANLTGRFLDALEAAVAGIEPEPGAELWMPKRDSLFRDRANTAATSRPD